MAFHCASAPALPQLVASGPEDGKAEVPSREDPAQASRDRLDAGGVEAHVAAPIHDNDPEDSLRASSARQTRRRPPHRKKP